MAIQQRRMTLEQFLALPEEEPALELEPDGTVVQKMSPKGRHSTLQTALWSLIQAFAGPRRLAVAFVELRTVFASAAYVPDVAVYRWERIPWTQEGEVPDDFTEPPDIAIEVVSPGQSVNSLVRRCLWYVDNGVEIAAVVDPVDRSVVLFSAGSAPRAVREAEPIDFSSVLPGLDLTADQLFSALRPGAR